MTRRPSQKTIKAFTKTAKEYLLALGATDISSEDLSSPILHLETKAGSMRIHLFDTWIAMRFQDVERAKEVMPFTLGLNPYSGKYNLILDYDELKDLTLVKERINYWLAPVLLNPEAA